MKDKITLEKIKDAISFFDIIDDLEGRFLKKIGYIEEIPAPTVTVTFTIPAVKGWSRHDWQCVLRSSFNDDINWRTHWRPAIQNSIKDEYIDVSEVTYSDGRV